MSLSRFRLSLFVIALLGAGGASADLAKLDPRARVALAQLRAGAAPARMLERGAAVTAEGSLDVFIRGAATRAELEAAGARVRTVLPGLVTAFVPVSALEAVAALPTVERIRGAAPVMPELDVSVPAIGVNLLRGPGPGFAGLGGSGVLIGHVDTGVDLNHGDFRNAAGQTRFVRVWDQPASGAGAPPPAFGYGREWTAAQINAGQATLVDESGHGTHVIGISGGDGSQTGGGVPAHTYAGVAPLADLAMVKTNFTTTGVVDGAQYCMDLAASRGQDVVVNLSLGVQFGPHDGTSDFEAALSAMSGPGRIVVKSAGNDRTTDVHAEAFAAGGGTDVTLAVTGSGLDRAFAIDGYYEATENVQVRVTTPGGAMIGPLPRGTFNAGYPGAPTANGIVYVENGLETTATGDFEIYIEVNVGAGQNMDGTWTLTFIPVLPLGPANGEVDLWQFFTTFPTTARFVTGNDRSELVSEPGNAVEVVTAGAWVSKTSWTGCNGLSGTFTGTPPAGSLATFSSPGPTRDGRRKPDIAAPGVAIGSSATRDIPQVCPSPPAISRLLPDGLNHVVMQGTSMAAPHVTGAVALLLENHGSLTPAEVKSRLATHARSDGFTGAVPNNDWGSGKLYLGTVTATLLALFQAEPAADGVELRWRLGEPERVSGLALERGESEHGPWTIVDAARGEEGPLTVVRDRSAVAGRTYYYRLVATLRGGGTAIFGPVEVTAGVPIAEYGLARVAPNPTRGAATIEFTVAREGRIRVSVLDLQGREVAVLAEGRHRPGRYQATWSGEAGDRPVPSGLYFVRYRTPERTLTGRVAVAR